MSGSHACRQVILSDQAAMPMEVWLYRRVVAGASWFDTALLTSHHSP